MGLSGLSGKGAVITGGASGIGLATARRLASEGVRVAILDINLDRAREAAAEIGGFAIQADMADAGSVTRAAAEAIELLGEVHLLHNNAAIGSDVIADLWNTSEDYFDKLMAVNVRGVWLCTRELTRHMRERGIAGAIVNMSSVSGIRGTRGAFLYAASKHAVIGMTSSIAAELAPLNIRINAVCPGNTDTPALRNVLGKVGLTVEDISARNPMPRVARPEEQAAMIAWLLSEEASFVTGGTFVVDGGVSSIIMY